MNRTITRTIGGLLAPTALVVGLAACSTATGATKVAPDASALAEHELDSPEGEAGEDPAVDIKTSFKVGETAKVGDWEVTVTRVTEPTDKQVQKWNEFNEKAKGQYVMADYSAKYVGTERTADTSMDTSWKFGGSDGQVYRPSFIVTNHNDAPTEARPGGTVKQQVVFDVPATAVKGGVVTVEGYSGGFDEQVADFAF